MTMAFAENLSPYSALLGEDLSIWSSDDHAKQFGDGAPLDATIDIVDTLVSSPGSESSDPVEGDQSDPLPEWMSEKMDVVDWLDDFDKPISHELPITKTELLTADSLIGQYDDAILDYAQIRSLENDDMLPLSPIGSIDSSGTAVNSSVASPGPFSPAESDSTGFDPVLSLEDESMMNVEALINSCRDTDIFLQLAGTVNLDLPAPSKGVAASLQEGVASLQTNFRGKIKTGEKVEMPCPPATPAGGPLRSGTAGKGGKPRVVTKERRERKKGQNKEAATRYRIKKKRESEGLSSQLSGLEKTNSSLKDQVGSLEKEINYLKELLQEIYKVKGQIKVLESP